MYFYGAWDSWLFSALDSYTPGEEDEEIFKNVIMTIQKLSTREVVEDEIMTETCMGRKPLPPVWNVYSPYIYGQCE